VTEQLAGGPAWRWPRWARAAGTVAVVAVVGVGGRRTGHAKPTAPGRTGLVAHLVAAR